MDCESRCIRWFSAPASQEGTNCKSRRLLGSQTADPLETESAKFTKDILYIHDALETFGGQLEDLRTEWSDRVRPQLHQRSVLVVERGAATLFGDVTDMIRRAARIASGRALSPELIQEVCHLGLKRIFG